MAPRCSQALRGGTAPSPTQARAARRRPPSMRSPSRLRSAPGLGATTVYGLALDVAKDIRASPSVLEALARAEERPPACHGPETAHVIRALHNEFHELLHAPSLEPGVVDTAMRGGDTDTNAAIAGALLGAVCGEDAVPDRWRRVLAACRPGRGVPGVNQPGPDRTEPGRYWPAYALALPDRLVRVAPTDLSGEGV